MGFLFSVASGCAMVLKKDLMDLDWTLHLRFVLGCTLGAVVVAPITLTFVVDGCGLLRECLVCNLLFGVVDVSSFRLVPPGVVVVAGLGRAVSFLLVDPVLAETFRSALVCCFS